MKRMLLHGFAVRRKRSARRRGRERRRRILRRSWTTTGRRRLIRASRKSRARAGPRRAGTCSLGRNSPDWLVYRGRFWRSSDFIPFSCGSCRRSFSHTPVLALKMRLGLGLLVHGGSGRIIRVLRSTSFWQSVIGRQQGQSYSVAVIGVYLWFANQSNPSRTSAPRNEGRPNRPPS
jgi:hypothetical protein